MFEDFIVAPGPGGVVPSGSLTSHEVPSGKKEDEDG